jgi:phosphoserine/homoserine phosphotransferase
VNVSQNSDDPEGRLESLADAGMEVCGALGMDPPEMPASEFTSGVEVHLPRIPLVAAFDLESVLVPEIWETVSRTTGVQGLALTTRDTPDHAALMRDRMRLCREHGLSLARLRDLVATMQPLPGAVEFLAWVQERMLAVIVSDTYHELAGPVVEKLGCPLMVCNGLTVDEAGYIAGHRPHHVRGKAGAVAYFQRLGFQVIAVGDSYNDLPMLKAADAGILFRPCNGLRESVRGSAVVWSLQELQIELKKYLAESQPVTLAVS